MFGRMSITKSTGNYSDEKKRLKKVIEEADAVVIGAGAGLSTSAGFVYNGERFEKHFSDFTSVEQIAEDLADWLIAHGHRSITCIYGCSMGGAVVTRFLADRKVKVRSAVIDGGITPYQLPWIVTRLIAIKDFLLISMGKVGGLKILHV